ncbi:hypothetical protein B566_EDAN003456 [Ephemera danica]|nr:hypothetical protein B566_EDAN003456 [Ephemera danica]
MNERSHLSSQFDQELSGLRSTVLQMGGLVETQISSAIDAYSKGDVATVKQIVETDRKVNSLEIAIDDDCAHLIAMRQPAASDLRLVFGVTKIVTDLERAGDEAKKIAKGVRRIYETGQMPSQYGIGVRRIAEAALAMLRQALDAFSRLDVELAVKVIQADADVDTEFKSIMRQLITHMMEDPRTITTSMDIIWIARAIERIGDHAKNVAEHVVTRHSAFGQGAADVTPTILVVEDEPAIQELVAINLRHAGFLVNCSRSAEEAESALRAALPDLVLLDWMLPGQSGVALAKKIRAVERTRALPIIMLTARVHEEDTIQGLEAGADDYVTKPFSPKELVARVRAVLRRRSPHLAGEAVEIGDLVLNPATHRALAGGMPVELGPTEFRLLFFFMTHTERVYTRSQLLDEIWGDHVVIEERTVDVHIRRLRAALEASGNDRRVDTVRGTGYRFLGG